MYKVSLHSAHRQPSEPSLIMSGVSWCCGSPDYMPGCPVSTVFVFEFIYAVETEAHGSVKHQRQALGSGVWVLMAAPVSFLQLVRRSGGNRDLPANTQQIPLHKSTSRPDMGRRSGARLTEFSMLRSMPSNRKAASVHTLWTDETTVPLEAGTPKINLQIESKSNCRGQRH